MVPVTQSPASRTLSHGSRIRPTAARRVPWWWRDASIAAFWGVLLFVTATWLAGGGVQHAGSLSGALDSAGRLSGLIASALLLVQVFLMARIPWFEQAWGQDKLARAHRVVGFTSFNLLWAHIVLITLGYAAGSRAGLWGTVVDFTANYPGMLLAIAGTAALCMVVFTSVKAARQRLRYESWHLIHLYGYLGAGLALPHQLWTGTDFVGHLTVSVFWWTLYAVCLAAVLVFRIGLPLARMGRHRMRVLHVREEAPGVSTVTVGGRHLAGLSASGGQFFHWRFLDGPGWTRANPYSLSAAPDGRTLRFTAAHAGDGSSRLSRLRPGTRVLAEGPYGRMHAGARTRRKVLLMGAGIGITPMRALLEDLPQRPGDVTIVHRVSARSDLVLDHEIDVLGRKQGAHYIVLEGHRTPHRDSWLPATAAHVSDSEALVRLCPDVAERDVYLCGAPAWMDAAQRAAREAGVPPAHIHLERFTY